jgi:hypothetical protein
VSTTNYQSLIENLSAPEKDELIVRLWQDLQNARARSKELEQKLARLSDEAVTTPSDASLMREKLEHAGGASDRHKPESASSHLGLGAEFGFLRSKLVLGAMLLIVLAFAADYAVGRYQQYRITQKQLAALQLQHTAYQGLFVEVVNVAYEPDQKSYRLTMRMTNVEPGRPIYVMQSPVRVFEQSGLSWKEVPSQAPAGKPASSVVKLSGPHTYETIFEPNLADWTELMPGYMHIRFEGNSLISQRSDPDDDIIERTDRYYVYLKPHGADDDAIRRRMKIQGAPPVFMPMPPH